MDGPRGEFNFIFIRQNHNEGIYSFLKSFIRRMFAFKCSSEFDWITHRQFDGQPRSWDEPAHSSRRKHFTKNLISTTSACWTLKLDLYFSIGKITTLTVAWMYSFRVSYVQCLTKRLNLNLIEFNHLKVWRSFDSLAVKNLLKNWTTTTSAARLRNPTGFVPKLFTFSREEERGPWERGWLLNAFFSWRQQNRNSSSYCVAHAHGSQTLLRTCLRDPWYPLRYPVKALVVVM